MYCLYTRKSKVSMEYVTFYLLKSVQNIKNISLGRPPAGNNDRVCCFSYLNTETAIPKPLRKQGNAFIFMTKIACHNAYKLF